MWEQYIPVRYSFSYVLLSNNIKQGQTNREFHGIIPPLLTPRTDSGELDREGISALVEHLVNGGGPASSFSAPQVRSPISPRANAIRC